jgi:hypothetical protein
MEHEMEREPAYWDCDDNKEQLQHECLDDAIEYYLDDPGEDGDVEEVTVYGYARKVVDALKFRKAVLEFSYDYLSEDYDGEDGHEQCDIIEAAAALFVETYIDNYTVWGCDLVKTEKVNAKEWIQKNRPDWLKHDK